MGGPGALLKALRVHVWALGPNAGMYGVKFVSDQLIRFLELREDDYDTDDIWVHIKKAN